MPSDVTTSASSIPSAVICRSRRRNQWNAVLMKKPVTMFNESDQKAESLGLDPQNQ
jgi:hypothetical protein